VTFSFTIYRYLHEGVKALNFSATPGVGVLPNITRFLAFVVILAKSDHLRTSQTPSRWMCCPVQGIAILNIVKRVALHRREAVFATSNGRQRVGEREYHDGS